MMLAFMYVFVLVSETSCLRLHLNFKCEDVYSHENWHLLDFEGDCGRSPPRYGVWATDADYGTYGIDQPGARSSWRDADDDDDSSYVDDDYIAPRIMRGSDAREHEFPWLVQLIINNSSVPTCGGSLINKRYVLTAAHCVTTVEVNGNAFRPITHSASELSIRLGTHYVVNTCYDDGSCPGFEQVEVEEIVPHSQHTLHKVNDKTYLSENDIALVRLKRDVELDSGKVFPICLPKCEMLHRAYYGRRVVAVGFGRNTSEPKIELPKTLQKLNAIVISKPCSRVLTMICIGDAENQGVCKGDSGSPLMLRKDFIYYQLGISSFSSRLCDRRVDKPFTQHATYTRVAPFMRWILDNVRE